MKNALLSVSVVVLGASALPALAASHGASRHVGAAMDSMAPKTRAEVRRELEVWRRNPVTSDGWRQLEGDAGWEFVGTVSTRTRVSVRQEAAEWRSKPEVIVDGWRLSDGEASPQFVGIASTKSRQQVLEELQAWRRNPVARDGWTYIGGEAGWTYWPGAADRRWPGR
jgi:hypothetical protein